MNWELGLMIVSGLIAVIGYASIFAWIEAFYDPDKKDKKKNKED